MLQCGLVEVQVILLKVLLPELGYMWPQYGGRIVPMTFASWNIGKGGDNMGEWSNGITLMIVLE